MSLDTTACGFDWDDNILHMPTKIKMDKKANENWEQIEVEPSEFAIIRGDKVNYRIRNNDPVQAFDEFVDFGPRGNVAFLEDVKIAINEGAFGPSWDIFINCLKKGKLFSIVTSRSHEYSSIRQSIEYIINNILSQEDKKEMYINCCGHGLNRVLLDGFMCYTLKNRLHLVDLKNLTKDNVIQRYLNSCKYYGVGLPFSNSFREEFNIPEGHTVSIQEAKKIALDKFIGICKDYSNRLQCDFALGFSDDDKKTVELIKEFFKEKSLTIPKSKLYVYETSDRKIKGGVKTKFIDGVIN